MSIVIIGGNERMERTYKDVCTSFGCKSKVFTKENGAIRKKIGQPDLMVVFTSTVSHKMMLSASQEAKKHSTRIEHLRSGSISALEDVLRKHCGRGARIRKISD